MRQGLCERISGSFGGSFGLERKNKGVRWERQGNNGLLLSFSISLSVFCAHIDD